MARFETEVSIRDGSQGNIARAPETLAQGAAESKETLTEMQAISERITGLGSTQNTYTSSAEKGLGRRQIWQKTGC